MVSVSYHPPLHLHPSIHQDHCRREHLPNPKERGKKWEERDGGQGEQRERRGEREIGERKRGKRRRQSRKDGRKERIEERGG